MEPRIYEQVHSFRTAGARLTRPILDEIKALRPTNVAWLPHSDCGALGFAFQKINGGDIWPREAITEQIRGILRSALRDHPHVLKSRANFDLALYETGRDRLKTEFGGLAFRPEFVDVTGLGAEGEKEKILLISEDTRVAPLALIAHAEVLLRERRGSSFRMEDKKPYIIQAPRARLAQQDMHLAAKALGINEIVMIPKGSVEVAVTGLDRVTNLYVVVSCMDYRLNSVIQRGYFDHGTEPAIEKILRRNIRELQR